MAAFNMRLQTKLLALIGEQIDDRSWRQAAPAVRQTMLAMAIQEVMCLLASLAEANGVPKQEMLRAVEEGVRRTLEAAGGVVLR